MTTEQAVGLLGVPPPPGTHYDYMKNGIPIGFVDTLSHRRPALERMEFLTQLNDDHKIYDGARFWRISPAALKVWEKAEDREGLMKTLKLLRKLNT